MNKTRLITSLVVAIAATVVALRYRNLWQLEAEQTQLRRQVEEVTKLQTAIAQQKPAPTTPPVAGLSSSEHLELLRLRNEVGQLRRELAVESNQVTMQAAKRGLRPVPASAYAPAEGVVTKEEAVVKAGRGKHWGVALIKYAIEHGDEFPARLADAAGFVPGTEGADDFELLVTGKMSAIRKPGQTIAFRERHPWQAVHGKWGRVYGFADGHMEVAYSATDDFTEWERQKTQTNSPPGQ